MATSNLETIDYRLNSIEQTLTDLKNVLAEHRLQNKEIEDLKESIKELIEGFSTYDKRIRHLEKIDYKLDSIEDTLSGFKNIDVEFPLQKKEIDDLKKSVSETVNGINAHDKRIRKLEVAPHIEKAKNWEHYVRFITEIILSSAILYILVRMGLAK